MADVGDVQVAVEGVLVWSARVIGDLQLGLPLRWIIEQVDIATQKERSSISLPEGEAQKTQPIQSSKPLRPRRYNFGPRKATIKLSESAVSHLRELGVRDAGLDRIVGLLPG